MEFRILGPLEAWHEGREVSLGGPKPRALLAVLLLHANEVVSRDQLLDELWGEDSATVAAGALRVNVSRLRKALLPDMLTTRSPGYVLQIEPGALDLHRFEHLVEEGRSLLGPRAGGRRVGAAPGSALALARPGVHGLRVRTLRAGSHRSARRDQARSPRAADRRRPGPGPAPRARRRARGARHRSPATRAPSRISHDRALPVGSASGGSRRLSRGTGRAPRRAGNRAKTTSSRSSNGRSSSTTRRSTPERPHAPLSRRRRSGRSSSRPPTTSGSALSSQWPSSSCVIPHACSSLRGWCRAQPTSRPHPPWLEQSAAQSSRGEASQQGSSFIQPRRAEKLTRLSKKARRRPAAHQRPLTDSSREKIRTTSSTTSSSTERLRRHASSFPETRVPFVPVVVPFGQRGEADSAPVKLGAWGATQTVHFPLAAPTTVPTGRTRGSRTALSGALAVQQGARHLGRATPSTPPSDDAERADERRRRRLIVGLSLRWHSKDRAPPRLRRRTVPQYCSSQRFLSPRGLASSARCGAASPGGLQT